MAIREIRIYPDPILRQPARAIATFDRALELLAEDMVETMHHAPGIGLAAPQVGESLRLAVVDLSVGKDPEQLMVLANPEVLEPEGSWIEEEGCLSIPEFAEKVERPEKILLRAQRLDGTPFERTAEGWLARALCHEIDHLNGILFVDHLRGLRRERARRVLKRLFRAHEET